MSGWWGENPFVPPGLLNGDPRDQVGLFKPLPWSPEDQWSLPAPQEEDELPLKFCQCFVCLTALNVLPIS